MKTLAIHIVSFLLRIFHLCKLKKNTILFESFGGSAYTCNPKYLYQYLRKHEGLQFVWVLKDSAERDELEGISNVTIVKHNSFLFFYYMLTCKVVIINIKPAAYLPHRKTQTVISTWHGGGAYKKMGMHIATENDERQKKLLAKHGAKMQYFISTCQRFTDVMQDAHVINKEVFLNTGSPRNDILIQQDHAFYEAINHKIRQRFGIAGKHKIALYAPTFRGISDAPTTDLKKVYDLDIASLTSALEEKFGGTFTVLFRAHYLLSAQDLFGGDVIDVSTYPDMQELLLISDVLINDYSSSMWDFSFTQKPCFIYASDVQDYIDDRDFYTPMAQWPFAIAQSNDELQQNIANFDQEHYLTRVAAHHSELGSFEHGHACQVVGDMILDIVKN